MTTTLSAALRMPLAASVDASAPLAPGASAEPRSPMPAPRQCGRIFGGIPTPATGGRRDGSSGRFGGLTRSSVGNRWYGQDMAQLAGGGPLRG